MFQMTSGAWGEYRNQRQLQSYIRGSSTSRLSNEPKPGPHGPLRRCFRLTMASYVHYTHMVKITACELYFIGLAIIGVGHKLHCHTMHARGCQCQLSTSYRLNVRTYGLSHYER